MNWFYINTIREEYPFFWGFIYEFNLFLNVHISPFLQAIYKRMLPDTNHRSVIRLNAKTPRLRRTGLHDRMKTSALTGLIAGTVAAETQLQIGNYS